MNTLLYLCLFVAFTALVGLVDVALQFAGGAEIALFDRKFSSILGALLTIITILTDDD